MRVIWSLSVLVLSILFLGFVSAEIGIVDDFEETYNLGDSVSGEAVVMLNEEEYVILVAGLECGGFDLEFYRSAKTLQANKTVVVSFPDIPVNKRMVGSCQFIVSMEDFEGKILESSKSEIFLIDDQLVLNVSLDKSEYEPGETVLLEGFLEELGNYNLTIDVDNEQAVNKSLFGKEFVEKIELGDNEKGIVGIDVEVKDGFGNFAKKSLSAKFKVVPSRLEIELISNESVYPGEFLIFKNTLFDQAGDFVNGEVIGSITGPDNGLVEEFNVSSGGQWVYQTGRQSPAGKYTIDVSGSELESYMNFIVEAVREVEMLVSDNELIVRNIGNVIYSYRGDLEANDGNSVYAVPLAFDLGLGESIRVDLSENLPESFYTLTVKEGEESFVFEEKFVEDNRVLSKKVSQGVSRITGNAIIDTESTKNFAMIIFLAMLAIGTLVYFTNNKMKMKVIGAYKDKVDVQVGEIGELNENLDEVKAETAKMKKLFGQYVDTDVIESHDEVKASGTEKREVTALFTDVRGFSAMFGDMDDKMITEMLNPYFKRSHEIVNKNGGMINKFIGDAVMALFNAPRKTDNHLLKGVRAGLEIQREIKKINEELKRQGKGELSIGIGVDTGSAAVGHLGGAGKIEYSAIGAPVNIAARLESKALGGQVLITSKSYQEIKDKVVAESVGKMQFKNIQGEFDVWNVTGLKSNVRGVTKDEDEMPVRGKDFRYKPLKQRNDERKK